MERLLPNLTSKKVNYRLYFPLEISFPQQCGWRLIPRRPGETSNWDRSGTGLLAGQLEWNPPHEDKLLAENHLCKIN